MTIAPTSFAPTSPGRWAEMPRLRPTEGAREAKTVEPPATAEAERAGPRRSPLFNALKDALDAVVAQDEAPPTTEAAPAEAPAGGAVDGQRLEQALVEFARALMHALREGGGPQGEHRGRHLGHAHAPAHGYRHHVWGDTAQRVEQLAQKVAPEAAAQPAAESVPATAPVQAPTEASAPVASADDAATPAPADPQAASPTGATAVHPALKASVPDSPWKAVHDGLIEAFAEVQRSLGQPADERDESLEEQLRDMLVALAAKLRTNELQTLALAPAGSLLSVVA